MKEWKHLILKIMRKDYEKIYYSPTITFLSEHLHCGPRKPPVTDLCPINIPKESKLGKGQ